MLSQTTLFLTLATLVLAGCAGPGRYPVSGQECSPDDPVLDITVPPCPPSS